MKNANIYYEPALHSTESIFNYDLYKNAIDLYQQEQYTEALHTFFDSLNPKIRKEYGNNEDTEYHIPHGSIIIDILLKGDDVFINSNFMKLPEKGVLPMLRQVATLNINNTTLVNFQLDEDILTMKYNCDITQTHPHKMYELLRELCYIGDKYDDEFETAFNAERIYQPIIKPYPQELIDRLYDNIQEIGNYTTAAVSKHNKNRTYGYAWTVLDTAFYQILYTSSLQGNLSNEISKAINDMDKDLPLQEIVSKGMKVLEKLASLPKEELAKDLYYIDTLISTKVSSSLNNIQANFKDTYEHSTQSIQSGNYEDAVIRILYKFYEMYYYCDVQDDIHTLVSGGLKAASGKSWEEASKSLYQAMRQIMDDDLDDETDLFSAFAGLADEAGEAMAFIQENTEELAANIQEIQQKMMEALANGDMEEYMRLATEMQQNRFN